MDWKHIFKAIFIASAMILSSCSTTSKKENLEDKAGADKVVESGDEQKLSEYEDSFKQELDLVNSYYDFDVEDYYPDQILGSANIEKPAEHRIQTYFLYGAEHLKLDNYYFDIPVVYNKHVKKWVNYFLNKGRGFFEKYTARAGRYAPLLGSILEKEGLPRDLIFLAMAESGFSNKAKSWAKAVGPWQFMSYTGKRYGLSHDWYRDERRDPIKATYAASAYLNKLYDQFGSWELAMAGYNAGEGKVGRAIKRYKTRNFWKLIRRRYLARETRNYVPKIMALAIIGKNLKAFGFEEVDFAKNLDFDEVVVNPGSDLFLISKDLGVEFDELHRYNPEILRWFTPPNVESYVLRLPKGKSGEFKKKWETCCKNKDYMATSFQRFKVTKRMRLKDVARKFRIKKDYVLSNLNNVPAYQRLKRGDTVLLPFRIDQSRRDKMFADLYEKPPKFLREKLKYKRRIRLAVKRGRKITSPKRWYTVRRGDSLWSVARKNGISLDTLIVSNLKLIKSRMIRAGDKLAVK